MYFLLETFNRRFEIKGLIVAISVFLTWGQTILVLYMNLAF